MHVEIMLINNILYRIFHPEVGEPYGVPIPNEELADFQNMDNIKVLNSSENQSEIFPGSQNEINQFQYMPNEEHGNIQNEYQNSIDCQYLYNESNPNLFTYYTENNKLNSFNGDHLSIEQPILSNPSEAIETYIHNRPFFIADTYGDLIQDFPCNKKGRPRKNPEKQTPISEVKKCRGRPRKNETLETLINKPKRRSKYINNLDCKTETVKIENLSKTEAADIETLSKTEAVDIENLSKTEAVDIENLSKTEAVDIENLSKTEAVDIENLSKTEAVDIENLSKTEAADIENLSETEAVDIETLSKIEKMKTLTQVIDKIKKEIVIKKQIYQNINSTIISKSSNSLLTRDMVTKKEPKPSYTNIIKEELNSLTKSSQIDIENVEIKTELHEPSYEDVDIEDYDFLKNFAYEIFTS